MLRATSLVIVVLAAALLSGCKTPAQMKAEYPSWPAWGWWEKPADDDAAPQAASAAETQTPSDTDADTAKVALAPAEPSQAGRHGRHDADPSVDSEGIDPLAEHRASIWPAVAKLRDIDTLPPEQRLTVLRDAKAKLPDWYAPMPVDAPDPASSDWITICVWDFMPEDEFQRAVDGCLAIAKQHNLVMPYPTTRRSVMNFMKDLASAPPPPTDEAETDDSSDATTEPDGETVNIQLND
jgi:hypothetical protein